MRKILCSVVLIFFVVASMVRAQIPSGSLVWLRSDTLVQVVNNRVVVWQDLSGHGNDASMSDTAYQPAFLPSAVNGVPAIKFNGSSYLACPNVFPVKHDYTICAVVKFDDGDPNNILSGEDHALYMYWDRTPRVQNHDAFSLRTSKIPFWESGFSTVVVPYSHFSQQAAIYVNAQEGERGYIGPNSDSTLYVGSYRKGFFLNGEIQEVIIYDRVLSAVELADLNSYLMQRYQISPALALPGPDSTFSALPRHLQLYPRDADDSATVRITGNIYNAGFDSIYCLLMKDRVPIARTSVPLRYADAKAAFDFHERIHAELSEYRCEVHLTKGALDTTIKTVDSITCGEVFLVDGQGNSSPAFISYRFQSEFCRSIGRKYTPDPDDTLWQISAPDGGTVGAWPLRFQQELLERYHMPSCCINGAVGGSSIEKHEPTDSNHLDLWTIYGKQLYQARKAGIRDRVKVLLWDQGESNYAEGYLAKFMHLYDAWKQDYPNLQKIYSMQLRPNGCYFGNIGMRDVQRLIPDQLRDVEVIAAAAIPGQDGCHFTDSGYMARCERFFLPYARDFLHASDTTDLRSPNPIWAWYSDPSHVRVAILFSPPGTELHATSDTLVAGRLQQMKDYLYPDDTTAKVSSVAFDQDTMFIIFDRSSSARSIGFTPDQYYSGTDSVYEGPWIVNRRGYGALLWHDLAIHDSPMSVERTRSTKFAVYPNPAINAATVDLTAFEGDASLILGNSLGQTVRDVNAHGGGLASIDYSGLAKGMYRLVVRCGKDEAEANVVIQ